MSDCPPAESQPTSSASILYRALELPAGADREAFLRRACEGQPGLRTEVDSLLKAREEMDEGFLQNPADLPVRPLEEGEKPGDVVGNCTLIRCIGEGGFGIVFEAEQHGALERRVALKLLKPGMNTRAIIARFRNEERALSQLEHPNIARIYEAGETRGTRPYFVMEYVAGVSITTFCEERRLPIEQRLRIFLELCRGVQHAHLKGFIHRDLKPSNLLVGEQVGRLEAKIIDFGLAKVMGSGDDASPDVTQEGTWIGTPHYMSPEQVHAEGQSQDVRSDVYSLGAVLYQLLTGLTPHPSSAFKEASRAKIERFIREVIPLAPSKRMLQDDEVADAGAETQGQDSSWLSRRLKGDLDCIVMKALEKEPEHRYQSVLELIQDLERHLHGDPVKASPPSPLLLTRRFVRRHLLPLSAAAAIVVTLLAGSGFSLWQAQRAWQAETLAVEASRQALEDKSRAESAKRQADEMNAFLVAMLRDFDPAVSGSKPKSGKVMRNAIERLRTEFDESPHEKVQLLNVLGGTLISLGMYDKALEVLEQALAIMTSAHTERESADLCLQVVQKLAHLYNESGQLSRSRAVIQRARDLAQERQLPDSESLLAVENQWVEHLIFERQYGQAMALQETIVDRAARAFGELHPFTISQRRALGHLYRHAGQPEESLRYFTGLLAEVSEASPVCEEEKARIESELAILHLNAGNPSEARKLAHSILYAANLPNARRLAARKLLLIMKLRSGQAEEAISEAELLVEDARDELGSSHWTTMNIRRQLAEAYSKAGRHADAVKTLRRLAIETRRSLGSNHYYRVGVLANLAKAQLSLSDSAGALETLKERDQILAQCDPAHQRQAMGSLFNLAIRYEKSGRWEEAERLLQARSRSLNEPHTKVVNDYLFAFYQRWNQPGRWDAWQKSGTGTTRPSAH